ncbi:MAG: hypothetical protein ACJ71Q_10190 [Terriglobales bacterium]|jgi:hypothetical protein
MRDSSNPRFLAVQRRTLCVLMMTLPAVLTLTAQSDRMQTLATQGTWHLHSRIPLGSDAILLQPSHRLVTLLATAEAPEFEGWDLKEQNQRPVLLDVSGRPVNALPKTITFRVTVGTRDRFANQDPMPFDCSTKLNEFLLDMHFQLQVFRGMQMREVMPLKAEMIGIPADEPSEERIYRATFNVGDIRPDDRIVLLVTDGAGARLSKFHLEFL